MDRRHAIAKMIAYVALALVGWTCFGELEKHADAEANRFGALKFIGLFLLTALALAFLFAWDFCRLFADRAIDTLFDMNEQPEQAAVIQKAELLRRQGFPFEAIELLREHIHTHKRDTHAGAQIAEIYEEDLCNPLAAALEYEEMLKWRIRRERWAKLAIRAAVIYAGDLGRTDRCVELMREVIAKCPGTASAASAARRIRLYDDVHAYRASHRSPTPA